MQFPGYASEHRRSLNKNHFNQIALTSVWDATDRLKIDGHIGYEKSTYRTPYDDKLYLSAKGGMTTSYASDGTSANNVYDWDTSDLSNYAFREFYFREFWNETSLREGVLNASYKMDDVFTLRAGGAFHRYSSAGSEIYNDGLYRQFSGDPVTPFANVFSNHKKASWVVGDFGKAFDHFNVDHTVEGATDIENTYRVTETTKSAYGQLDWDGSIGGMRLRLRGNAGLRAYVTRPTISRLNGISAMWAWSQSGYSTRPSRT